MPFTTALQAHQALQARIDAAYHEAYRREQAEERAQRRWQRLVHDMQQGRRMEQKRQVVARIN